MTIAESAPPAQAAPHASAPEAGGDEAHPRKRPFLTIRPKSGWSAIDTRELWRFRELLLSLTGRDIKLRYKQTALGIIWVILQPLVAAGIFSVVFGLLARMPADKTTSGQPIPYFLFSFAGMVAWMFFLNAVTKISTILVTNSSLVSKVYFPRMLLPMSGGLGMMVDLGVALAMLLVIQLCTGVGITWQWLLFPVILGLVISLSLGIGMWASALCVEYRDVAYILPVMLQFLFYATPVGYSASLASGHGTLTTLYYLNPLAALLSAWRWSVLSTPFPPVWAFVYSAVVSLLLLVVGAFIFRRMERNFADVI